MNIYRIYLSDGTRIEGRSLLRVLRAWGSRQSILAAERRVDGKVERAIDTEELERAICESLRKDRGEYLDSNGWIVPRCIVADAVRATRRARDGSIHRVHYSRAHRGYSLEFQLGEWSVCEEYTPLRFADSPWPA